MAVITAGLYRLDLVQDYGNQEILNTFWYRHGLDDNFKADELAAGFNTVVLPSMAAVQNQSLFYTNIRVTPIFGGSVEVNLVPTTTVGLIAGDPTAAFIAVSIRLNRSTSELRHGWKRICGLTEGNVTRTGLSAGFLAICVTLADVFTSEVDEVAETFFPQIVRKPFTTKDQTPDWEAIQTTSGLVPDRQTTQNTRKDF